MSYMTNLYHRLDRKNKVFLSASRPLCLSLGLFIPMMALGAEISVGELSSGACWYQQSDEVLKLSSFNEKKSLTTTQAVIEEFNYHEISKIVGLKKDTPYQLLGITLHCGGYGSSLVLKSKLGDAQYCSWIGLGDNELKVRSIGGLEEGARESSLCDGYKNLELIVGLESREQIHELKRENLRSVIKSVSAITDTMVKVILEDHFIGKEDEAMAELKRSMSLKYIEYNLIQHQVGESVGLK